MSSSAERTENVSGVVHRDASERGRIVMAEISWLSDYVSATERSTDRLDAGVGQGIAGLMGIGLEADAQSWQERALCAETDPEAFFPEKGGSTRAAKKNCTGGEGKDGRPAAGV